MNSFGFETLDLKFRDLKLWKLTVCMSDLRCMIITLIIVDVCSLD